MDRDQQAATAKAREISDWHRALVRERSALDVVEAIRARRRAGAPGEDALLAMALQSQLTLAALELKQEAEAVIDEMIERLPDDVRFPIAKVSLRHYAVGDLEGALACSEPALARAERTGFFRRELLGKRARIFGALGRYDELNATLEAILALEMKPGIPDISRERDFVDRAPPGAIRPDVRERYDAFRPKREGD
jgi:tetratricopeptide (TPR) repeat protein